MTTAEAPKRTTIPKNDDGAEVLRLIRRQRAEIRQSEAQLSEAWNTLWALTYRWVKIQVAAGRAEHNRHAMKQLAGTLRTTSTAVYGWFNCGRRIVEHDIDVKRAAHSAVRLFTRLEGSLPKASRLRILSKIKEAKAPKSDIMGDIRRSQGPSDNGTARRLGWMEKQGRLTKNHVKMELMAALAAARKAWGKDTLRLCLTDENYVPLVELGD